MFSSPVATELFGKIAEAEPSTGGRREKRKRKKEIIKECIIKTKQNETAARNWRLGSRRIKERPDNVTWLPPCK